MERPVPKNGASKNGASKNGAPKNGVSKAPLVKPHLRPGPATLGPVADLEHHLPPDWWRSLFGPLYLKTDGDVVEDPNLTKAEIDEILALLDLDPEKRVLDLCCGQGRHCLELARRGFDNVVGIDRSRYLVRVARRRARQEGLKCRFHEGDARMVGSRRESFDAILLLGNSFGYFDKADDDLSILRGMHRILEPGGKILLDVADGAWLRQNYEKRSWEWIDEMQFVCRERSLTQDGTRLVSREVITHAERGVIVDQFYAERLYDEGELRGLLERAGYVEIADGNAMETESSRNQDLGMMARRFRLVARKPERAVRRSTAGRRLRCTVLLGDPRLEDRVKLEGHFNEEDLQTVRRLKEALEELSAMDVEYLDDHATMMETLRKNRPDFVLNLCDEGFRNDPDKELHVPAYLEMLDIPHSGGNPACLSLCYDKAIVRAIAMDLDVPVPAETSIAASDGSATLPMLFPALLKPARGDSSVGIWSRSIVHGPEEALELVSELAAAFPGENVLVQEFLSGPEYSIGLIGNPGHGLRALPALEVDYGELPPELPQILGYESKWDPTSPYWTKIRYVPARCDEGKIADMISQSMRLFQRLGCRDYARFDFRSDAQGEIRLLEVNPNPGWCWDGKLNLMAGFENTSYAGLIEAIIDAALTRLGLNKASSRAELVEGA